MAPLDLLPHGPKITHIFVNPPQFVVVQWILSLLCWWIVLICFFRHRHSLLSAPESKLRKHYLTVIAFPLVICSLSVVCLISVRPSYMWFLGQKLYEARTLYAFGRILLLLLGKDPEKIANKLRTGTPKRIISAPPLLCWLYPCTSATYAPVWLVKLIPDLVSQFVIVVPLTGVIELWLFLDGLYSSRIPEICEILSMLIAMQGLFIIYLASHDLLKSYNPTRKFVCIKLIVIIAAVQKFIIESTLDPELAIGHYDESSLVSLWQSFLLSIESVIFSILMTYAFPVSELLKHHLGDSEDGIWQSDESVEDLEEGKTKLIPTREKGRKTVNKSAQSPSPTSSHVNSSHPSQTELTSLKKNTTETPIN